MAIIKSVSSKASLVKAINYVKKEEKTEERLVSGKDCNAVTVIDEMKTTKQQWRKTEGRQYKHYIQSFDPNKDNITPGKAHQIGHEWAEENFKGYEVLIATHKDKSHIHNHFIVNSVSYNDGKKIQDGPKEKNRMRESSDKICEREGFSTIKEKSKEITTMNQQKYKIIEKAFEGNAKSYVLETAKNVSNSLKSSADKESFIANMEGKGYKVHWTENRKNITYTTPDGKKVRSSNLEKTFKEHKFSKEGMEHEIQRNRGEGRASQVERSDTKGVGETINGNERTQQTNAGLHKSSDDREHHEKDNSRHRVGKNEKDKPRNTGENGLDITKAREHAEQLRRETATAYGNWKDRNDGKQSKGVEQNGTDRKSAQSEYERDAKHNNKQHGKSKNRGKEHSR